MPCGLPCPALVPILTVGLIWLLIHARAPRGCARFGAAGQEGGEGDRSEVGDNGVKGHKGDKVPELRLFLNYLFLI